MTVKAAVKDIVGPLAEEVAKLARQIHTNEAVKEALEQTTAKGHAYEDEVIQAVQGWTGQAGIEVHHVGADNQPGDIVLVSHDTSLAGVDFRVVIEARDRSDGFGRRRISEDIAQAIVHRQADAGIYISKTRAGLAAEIVGGWAEGACDDGPWVATVHENLDMAVRWLLIMQRLAVARQSAPALDLEGIEGQLQRIRTAIERIAEINRKVTAGKTALEGIRTDGEAIRAEIRDALTRIEEGIRSAGPGSSPPQSARRAKTQSRHG
jgi:hypothetical protein